MRENSFLNGSDLGGTRESKCIIKPESVVKTRVFNHPFRSFLFYFYLLPSEDAHADLQGRGKRKKGGGRKVRGWLEDGDCRANEVW